MTDTPGGGELRWLPLEQLAPDWDNPRFLPGAADELEDELAVYEYIDSKYDAFSVADSIARHGFFASEPLIALPAEEDNLFVVVEGNRRLTALKALVDPAVRAVMSRKGWEQLETHVTLPDEFPVLVMESREQVAPILGFRHITGIAPWDPYQQARYVAELIDQEELRADEVAELVGRDASEVRAFYRNYSIVEQADVEFALADVKRVIDEFGVWTRAMTSVGIRDYIGAPAPREVVERAYPLGEDAREPLATLFVWIFGQPRSKKEQAEGKQSPKGRVISDSRQLSRLGRALQHPRAREALEKGEPLAKAEQAMLDRRSRFVAGIKEAAASLNAARPHRPKTLTAAMEETLTEIEQTVADIRDE